MRPLVADVSARAGSWWDSLLQKVNETYLLWLEASPIERLQIKAPVEFLEGRQSERLAQRVTTMLLGSLPGTLRSELISTRRLNVCEMLFHIHKVYQPGGTAERQQMLQALMETKAAASARGAVDALTLEEAVLEMCGATSEPSRCTSEDSGAGSDYGGPTWKRSSSVIQSVNVSPSEQDRCKTN